MNEIDSNRHAWGTLAEEHYHHFKQLLQNGTYRFNAYIDEELGDISGQQALHLQCNTGADTLLLASRCAHVTGVDLVPQNVAFARRLAEDLQVNNVDFVQSDVMQLNKAPLGQHRTKKVRDGERNLRQMRNAKSEGLLEVNRAFCSKQML